METRQAVKNLKLYYWFKLTSEPLFWGPILITYINAVSGMSLSEIYFMEAICVIGIIFLQVPTGALADLIGRRKTLIIGTACLLADTAVFACANSKLTIWLANFAWVLGFSLASGADTALFYDTLKFLGRGEDYQKIEAKAQAYRFFLAAVTASGVGYLAKISLRLPIGLDIIVIFIHGLVTCLFTEPPRSNGRQTTTWPNYCRLMAESFTVVIRQPKIIWIIACSTSLIVVTKIWFFSFNPYFQLVNVPLEYYGWIFCLLNLVAGLCSLYSPNFIKRFGNLVTVIVLFSVISVSMILMGAIIAPLSVMFILSENIVRGSIAPFTGQLLHDHVESDKRATIFSIQSAVRGFGELIMLLIFSLAVGAFALPQCISGLGITVLIIGAILTVKYVNIFVQQTAKNLMP